VNLKDIHRVYFVGIGGIGMSAIARWFNSAGYIVYGYDKTPSIITNSLIDEGISISYDDTLDSINKDFIEKTDTVLVIYTPAISSSNKIFNFFNKNNYNILKRSEALGLLVSEKLGIAVAGTHGKTSISTNIAWLIHNKCDAFLGGISKNLDSNVIINKDSEKVVVEADEFDRSFLTLYPDIAIISSIDADHLDIYDSYNAINKTFHQFISQIKPQGKLIYKLGLDIDEDNNKKIKYYTYSLSDENADYYASNIKIDNGYYTFSLNMPDKVIDGFRLGVPGLYNLENAISALACVFLIGEDTLDMKQNLESYSGVKRRFDYQIKTDDIIFIDDYAHHPNEIKASIESVRHLYPQKSITVIFQPHLFSRTKDFAYEFAKSLELSDNVILTDIYPAREMPIEGVDSSIILDKIENTKKTFCMYDAIADTVADVETDIIITMGAGSIDRLVSQIKDSLIKKYALSEQI
jgi:UDP-N-acetylmuramate--alanine ligase